MNKNEKKQNNNQKPKEKKKSFLSNLIQVEDTPKPQEEIETKNEREIQEKDKEQSADVDQIQQTEQPQVSQEPEQLQEKKLVKPMTKDAQKKNEKKSQKEKSSRDQNGLTEEEKLLLRAGEGVNLIPKKSRGEIKKEKKKFSFNLSSILSLIILITLSLGIVFFNILSKQQLNVAKEKLYARETELGENTDKIISNEAIVERIDLYKHLQQGVFSPKEILEYIIQVVNRAGNITIRTFELGNDLGFEMSGNSSDLSVVARLWYLLGIDDNIITVNLESVGKSDSGVSFTFRGELNSSNFIEN